MWSDPLITLKSTLIQSGKSVRITSVGQLEIFNHFQHLKLVKCVQTNDCY